MRKLFLTWQDKESRKWFPVGQLTHDGKLFHFFYIKGAFEAKQEANFEPLVSFPDFREVYESLNLFPMFSNRVMPRSRPEYKEMSEYLSLPEDQNDPLAFLARSGGAKVTDTFELFCYPKLENRKYHLYFFAHGLSYLPNCSIDRIKESKTEEKLYLASDFQNPYESNALQLHTRDNHIVGYCPRYLLDDLNKLRKSSQREDVEVCIARINDKSAPLQFRLLCRLEFSQNFEPFSSETYKPIVSNVQNLSNDLDITFA